MDLERMKQLSYELGEQHIILKEQFEKLQERLFSQEAVVLEDLERNREAMEVYEIKKDDMTRRERRAYLMTLTKKRKH